MMQPADFQTTMHNLERAVEDGLLTGELLNVGRKLLDQLQKPAQVTIIGYPGVGKTSLMRMLLAGAEVPDLVGVPVFEVGYGPSERVLFETQDGKPSESAGRAHQHNLPAGVFRVTQLLPLPQLADKTLTEVSLAAAADAQKRALNYAIETTDFTIWCTQDFQAAESETWAHFPEELKDHSFLALTKADQLQMKGTLQAQTTRFENDWSEEFLSLFPIATKQAIAAHEEGELADPALWASSGGKALRDNLHNHIDTGRRADLDYVQMLLAHVSPKMVEPQRSQHRGEEDKGTSSTTGTPEIAPMKRTEAVETALAILQDCADEMAASAGGAPQPKEMLAHSAQAAQAMATLLMDAGSDDAHLNALREDVLESEQVIMLLQLEGTDTAARDAVSALLQLKKEMAEVAYA